MSAKSYIYSSAKLRALEPKILDQTDIERMVDAPDLESAFKVLNDTDYADNLLDLAPAEYRKALSEDYLQTYKLLQEVSPNRDLVKIIFLDRDLVNIKLLVKAKYFDLDINDILKENCVYRTTDLKNYILEKVDTGLDVDIKNLIDEALKNLPEDSSPDLIDTQLSKGYFALLEKIAKRMKNELIKDYVKTLINSSNILTILRGKRLNLDKTKMAGKLINGGSLNLIKLGDAYAEDIKNLRNVIANAFDKTVVESFDQYTADDILFNLEKALEDYKTRLISKARLIAAGPEVILYYHLAKQNAVSNIRIIMTGKENGINSEEIKKTLRLVR